MEGEKETNYRSMNVYKNLNVTLAEEDGELTLYVQDDNVGVQQLALLPEELAAIVAVIEQYNEKK